jgi:alpha-galactosidase
MGGTLAPKLMGLLAVALAPALAGPVGAQQPVKVFVLAGQSNMQGHGHARTLDWLGEDAEHGRLLKSLRAPDGSWIKRDDAWIYYDRGDGAVKKGPLTGGYGVRDDRIGPEWMFGTVMADHFENPVLLIKTAWGGRSLAINFRPPSAGPPPLERYPEKQRQKLQEEIQSGKLVVGKEYREMVAQTKAVLADLKTHFPELSGRDVELAGFVWFQGWNDMIDPAFTAEYASNLGHLLRDLPKDLGVPNLPAVVGEMGIDGPDANAKIQAFRKAQAEGVAAADLKGRVKLAPTAACWDPVAAALLKEGWKNRKWATKEMEEKWNRMGSQEAYHYMGSAKVYSLVGFSMGQSMKELLSKQSRFTPTSEYDEKRIEGWTVKVHRAVEERAVRLLETRLADVARLVPAKACEELRKVPIWLGGGDGGRAGAQYHPDRGWLEKNGYNPEKAKAVDLGNDAKFLHEVRRQPFMVLHELAHAYHDRVLGFGHEGIRAAYEGAAKAGKYDSVLFWDGRKVKHYALKDAQEYFAEGSESFFGTNDFYPFVRAELKEHDPALFDVLEAAWGTRER